MRSNQLRARIAAGLVAGLVAFGFASSASKAAAAPQHAPRIPLSAKLATNAAWSSSNWSGYAKSSGHSFSTTKLYAGPQTSAEWIQEAPTVNGTQAKVAHYSTFPFDPGTVNGANPHLSSSNRGVMVQSGHQVSTPSSQDSDTDGFRMAYGATAPSPPSS